MKATYERQYRKQGTGKLVFVYILSGTVEQLAAYKTSKGTFNVVDDKGIHRFFSTRFLGNSCPMIKTGKDAWVADTTELDKLANLTAQYGYEIAKGIMNSNQVAATE